MKINFRSYMSVGCRWYENAFMAVAACQREYTHSIKAPGLISDFQWSMNVQQYI